MSDSFKRVAAFVLVAILIVTGVLLIRHLGVAGGEAGPDGLVEEAPSRRPNATEGGGGPAGPNVAEEGGGPAGTTGSSYAAEQFYVPNPVPAPEFTLQTLAGEPFRLADTRGRVVVLNFWATWCGPCRFEIPDFVEMQDEFGRENVVFVGVSLDDEASPEEVRAFTEELEVNYPVMLDDGSAHAEYGPITSLPTTFVIDREGRIQAYIPGMVTRELLRPLIADLLDGRAR